MKTAAAGGFAVAIAVAFCGLGGCNKAGNPSPAQAQAAGSTVLADTEPASGNLAPAGEAPGGQAPLDQSVPPVQPAGDQNYPQSFASDTGYSAYDLPADDQGYSPEPGYEAANGPPVEATEPPPPLPDYSQPPCPGDGYYWTPGYWAYSDGYYWVPGAWVLAPWVDALWTPPYWDYENGYYLWHAGYWGPHIGFYGGVNYGFGYTGRGYYGAYWRNGTLNYNRDVTNVNTTVVHNVYNYAAPRGNNSRVSYNGGHGGISTRPTPQEMAVVHDPRSAPVSAQLQHQRQAAANRAQFSSAGHAQPSSLVAASPLQTSYKAPAQKPPAAALRAAARPAPVPAQTRPNETRPNEPANRPGQLSIAPRPEARSEPQIAARPAPQARPAPEVRPQTEARPAPAPRPAPEARPAPVRPAPAQPEPAARSAPAPRPAPAPKPAPPPKEEEKK